MLYELTAVEKVDNDFGPSYKLEFHLVPGDSGAIMGVLTLDYKYLPLLDVGTRYDISEILEA